MSFKLLQHMPPEERRITIPTMITFARIALVPCVIGAMITQHWGAAFWLFVVAAVSDSVDGFLARWLHEQTMLGACLDPVADKLLVIGCFITLAFIQSPLFAIPLWFVLLVLLKEVLLLMGAYYIFVKKGIVRVQPTLLGKTTMFVQIVFIMWLFACYFFCWLPIKTYHAMLGLVIVLVFTCLLQYARIGHRTWLAYS